MLKVRALSVLVVSGLLATALPAAGQDAAVATAPAGPGAAPSVTDQIDAYLKTSPAVLPKEGATGVTPGTEPRKVHGEVDVAVGTRGYRSAYIRSDLPIGKTGTLSIAVQESRIDGRFGPRQRQNLGLDLAFSGDALDPADPRCRQALDQPFGRRSDPQRIDGQGLDGQHLRPCRPAEALGAPQPELR